MGDEVFCRQCKRELTGVLEVVIATVGIYSHEVNLETSDCNWRLCESCKVVICKRCDDERGYYCCDEGFILSRERAASALKVKRAAEA
jgi:hypothetical protein